MMKKLLILFFVLFCVFSINAQSIFRTINSKGLKPGLQVEQVSFNNAWFGSSFSYKLTGDADFNENFLFNANVIYNIDLGESGWNIPVSGNIMLPPTGDSFNDMEIGLYPWKILNQTEGGTVFVLHGGIAYVVDPKTETELSPQSMKILAGAEVSFPLGQERLPVTISLTPTWESKNLDRGSDFGLAGTFIFPIASEFGIIGDLEVPFNGDLQTFFSLGVLVHAGIGE